MKQNFTAYSQKRDWAKLAVVSLVSLYFLRVVINPSGWNFFNYIDLIFHEAGHIIFMPFGDFMTIAGGTILQILIPIVLVFYFFTKRKYFSSALLLFWVGQNFLEISVYAGDAIKMQLPLLGGDTSGHDWNNMLFQLGWLKYTDEISLLFQAVGSVIVFVAIYFSIILSVKKDKILQTKP